MTNDARQSELDERQILERDTPETSAVVSGEKLYYSISEVATITSLEAYVLRFWEKEFPSLRPRKNRSGNRIYQKRDIEMVTRIKLLLYHENYTIEGARARLRAHAAASDPDILSSNDAMKNTIRAVKLEIEDTLRFLDGE